MEGHLVHGGESSLVANVKELSCHTIEGLANTPLISFHPLLLCTMYTIQERRQLLTQTFRETFLYLWWYGTDATSAKGVCMHVYPVILLLRAHVRNWRTLQWL